jgi:hypothetical protein
VARSSGGVRRGGGGSGRPVPRQPDGGGVPRQPGGGACLDDPAVVGFGGGGSRCACACVCVCVCVCLCVYVCACVRRHGWRAAATARRGRAAATAGRGVQWQRPGGGGRGGPCAFFSKINFAERNCGLSAHKHREGDPRLLAKGPSPAGLHREAFAESFLSVKAPL